MQKREKILEEIIVKNFPNLVKNINFRSNISVNNKKDKYKDNYIYYNRLLKAKDKEKMPKAAGET